MTYTRLLIVHIIISILCIYYMYTSFLIIYFAYTFSLLFSFSPLFLSIYLSYTVYVTLLYCMVRINPSDPIVLSSPLFVIKSNLRGTIVVPEKLPDHGLTHICIYVFWFVQFLVFFLSYRHPPLSWLDLCSIQVCFLICTILVFFLVFFCFMI